jgi:trehalose 6-phosphate phosphatase
VNSEYVEVNMATRVTQTASVEGLPSALERLHEIIPDDSQEPALFLDFDGTLTPIVAHPDEAYLSDSMHETLLHLSKVCEIAVISGRDLADVRQRVGIDGIWYAGNHGFDIAGPERVRKTYDEGIAFLPLLDKVELELRDQLAGVSGTLIERKRFAIAAHYRLVTDDDVDTIKRTMHAIQVAHPDLRLSAGKKIFELQPNIDWDKGKALRWMMQAQDMDPVRFIPVYIGDDVTDEDAFRELEREGIGIVVTQAHQPTHAAYRLNDVQAVEVFLNRVGAMLDVT